MPKLEKPKFIQKECKYHSLTEYVLEGRGSYRCKKCRSERVSQRRRDLKKKLVDYFGGKCVNPICSYDRCIGVLSFHHLDPAKKDFGLSSKGLTQSFEKLLKEAKKCVMVCKNCHTEIHAGLLDVTSFPARI